MVITVVRFPVIYVELWISGGFVSSEDRQRVRLYCKD